MEVDRVTTTLKRRVKGQVRLDHESLAAASRDFGGVTESRPRVVVWPDDTDDVVAIVRTARETDAAIAVRGAGHSQGGQALNRGGIVVHTQRLNQIEAFSETEGWISAGAGLLWSELVGVAGERNLLPPVMTDNLKVTLGGTLAVGGVGPASFRHGSQIDHCLSLEIVLGTGDVIGLSAEHQPRLFRHVLGGLGQFGIITKVRLRLRSAPRFIHSHDLIYDNVETFLADAGRLMAREAVCQVSGCALPKSHPGAGPRHDFVLTVSTEMDQPPSHGNRHLIDGASPVMRSEEVLATHDYLARLDATLERFQRPSEKNLAHPWVEHFLPPHAVPEYVEVATRLFPKAALLLWPMRAAKLRQPMFCVPDVDDVVLVGIMCSVRHSDLADVLPRLRKLDKLGAAWGGKRYLSGWLDFDTDRWRQHYGVERWQEITSLQRQCDPDHLFRLWERTTD